VSQIIHAVLFMFLCIATFRYMDYQCDRGLLVATILQYIAYVSNA